MEVFCTVKFVIKMYFKSLTLCFNLLLPIKITCTANNKRNIAI